MIFACPFCHAKVGKTENTCHACSRVMTQHCAYCAEPISVLANVCKYCGEGVEAVAVEPPVVRPVPAALVVHEPNPAPTPPPRAEAPDVEFLDEVKYVAWEDKAKRGIFRRWWSSWADSQFSPGEFWRRMPTENGHWKAHSYAGFFAVQSWLLLFPIFALVGGMIGMANEAPGWAYAVGALAYAATLPVAWMTTVVGNYIVTTVWHVVLKILGGTGTYQGTLRIVAYNAGAGVWGWIPGVGALVQMAMGCIGNYHGFRGVHGLSKGRAAFAALLPVLLGLAAVAGLFALMVCAGACGADC